jgi:asparagine synthase (glutamine-hydrolysing)
MVLIFNGEIFNYKELKAELVSLGYRFDTESDTEVVIKAFHCWGEECVQKFNGFWSIIIAFRDEAGSASLFVSRDRFGIKPLYYYFKDDLLIFCSEIKGIKEVVGSLELNDDYLIDHFTYDNDDNISTTFRDVFKFPPRSNCTIDLRQIAINPRKFWTLEKSRNVDSLVGGLDEFTHLFEDSLNLRMRSDVEVALTLSGGIDSSAIAVACKKHNYSIKAFTSAFPSDDNIDESYYAALVSDKCNLKHKFVYPTIKDIDLEIDKLVKALERPFTSFSQLVNYFVMREISNEGIKVFLNGQGSDEVFLGYDRYFVSYVLSKGFNVNKFFHTIKNSDLSLTALASFLFYFGGTQVREQLYTRRAAKVFVKQAKSITNGAYKINMPLEKLKYEEVLGYQLQRLLEFDDKISSSFSLEGRPVFLDHRLVEFGFNLDDKLVINNGWNKYIVRQYLSKNGLPEVAWRKNKLGFPSPHSKWLNSIFEMNRVNFKSPAFIKNNISQKKDGSLKEFEKNVLLQVYLLGKNFT